MAGAAAALYGPLHGGANEAVLRMLAEIGTVQNVPGFIKRVKAGEGRLMGFGHRVYKSYDPRAKIIKRTADQVFEVTGRNPLLDIALELERIALEDEYFITRRLYPNVDFYSGLIYQAMGFPVTMFPVLFAIPRTSGWIAQWEEMLLDPEQKIAQATSALHRRRRDATTWHSAREDRRCETLRAQCDLDTFGAILPWSVRCMRAMLRLQPARCAPMPRTSGRTHRETTAGRTDKRSSHRPT